METRAVHLPLDLHQYLTRIAEKNRRTVPAQLRVILEQLKSGSLKLDKRKTPL